MSAVQARLISFVLLVLTSFLVTGVVTWQLQRTADQRNGTQASYDQTVDGMQQAEIDFQKQVQSWKDLLLRGAATDQRAAYIKEFGDNSKSVEAELSTVLASAPSEQAKASLKQLQGDHRAYDAKYAPVIVQYDANGGKNPDGADAQVKGTSRGYIAELDTMIAKTSKERASRVRQIEHHAKKELIGCLAGGAGVLLVISAFVFAIQNRVSRALLLSTKRLRRSSDNLAAISAGLVAGEQMEDADVSSTNSLTWQVQTVAAAVDEMTSSVEIISSNAHLAHDAASNAAERSDSAREMFSRLSESSEEIGRVVDMITSIAAQTNLLALNATIEAARAGTAGKGFAVVANEVKDLAKQTSEATEQISLRISAIQNDTDHVVSAIDDVSESIAKVNDLQAGIAASVQQQSMANSEIARSINAAAEEISGIATTTAAAVSDLREVTGELLSLTESGDRDAAVSAAV